MNRVRMLRLAEIIETAGSRELSQAKKDLESALKAGNRAFKVLGDSLSDDVYTDLDKALKLFAKCLDRVQALGEDVGDELIRQLGGLGRLRAMLGAQLSKTPKGINMRWPSKMRSRGNFVKITLAPDDTYTLEFFNASAAGMKKVKSYDGVYVDSLKDTFETQTGYRLSL